MRTSEETIAYAHALHQILAPQQGLRIDQVPRFSPDLTVNDAALLALIAARADRAKAIVEHLKQTHQYYEGEFQRPNELYTLVTKKQLKNVRATAHDYTIQFIKDPWKHRDCVGWTRPGYDYLFSNDAASQINRLQQGKRVNLDSVVFYTPSIEWQKREIMQDAKKQGMVYAHIVRTGTRPTLEQRARAQLQSTIDHELRHIHDNIIVSGRTPIGSEVQAYLIEGSLRGFELDKETYLERKKQFAERAERYRQKGHPESVIENEENLAKKYDERTALLTSAEAIVRNLPEHTYPTISYAFSITDEKALLQTLEQLAPLLVQEDPSELEIMPI